jgi:hypothetical protein
MLGLMEKKLLAVNTENGSVGFICGPFMMNYMKGVALIVMHSNAIVA